MTLRAIHLPVVLYPEVHSFLQTLPEMCTEFTLPTPELGFIARSIGKEQDEGLFISIRLSFLTLNIVYCLSWQISISLCGNV